MTGKRYTEEFKIAAVKQITMGGHPVGEVGKRLGVTTKSLYDWRAKYGDPTFDPNTGFYIYLTDPNLDIIGWYDGNSSKTLQSVRQKAANAWGLYDMSGNVMEWTWDFYGELDTGDATDPKGPSGGDWGRVYRGGSFNLPVDFCRSSARSAFWPDGGDEFVGVRLVRTQH